MAGARSDYAIKRYIDETKRLYSVLELRLSKADWLAGNKYTIADIANYSWVKSDPILLDIDLSEWPGVDKWVKRIDKRPAVQKAKNVPSSSRTMSSQPLLGARVLNPRVRQGPCRIKFS